MRDKSRSQQAKSAAPPSSRRGVSAKPLRALAEGLLTDALGRLEARVRARLGTRPPGAADRLREVVERDRAVASAQPARDRQAPSEPASELETAPAAAPAAPPAAPVCDEPIRTRTLARLLAAQGERERALRIYAFLIAEGNEDPELKAEADALRAAHD